MERQKVEDDYFRQHNSAIMEQQRRFRLNMLRLQREQQMLLATPAKKPEEETRGTFHEQFSTDNHINKTIAVQPQKSDIMNIYVNNRLVNRSFNSFEQIIKSVKTMPKRQRGVSDAAVYNKPTAPFNMIIPFIMCKQSQQREQRSSQVKLDKLTAGEAEKKDKLHAIYKNRKLNDNRNINTAARKRSDIQIELRQRKITEMVDNTAGDLTRKLEDSQNVSQMHGSKHYIPGKSSRRNDASRQRSPQERQKHHELSNDSSPERQKDTDRSRQLKIEAILKRRPENQDFDTFIDQFAMKMNYPAGVKLFIFKSHDEYVRRLLLKMGWVENTLMESQAYHLKWTINDAPDSYAGFFTGRQFFNHFANGFKLTSKTGLHTHFYRQNRPVVSHLYPRSFDIQNEQEEFMQEYERTAVLCLLKKHIRYFHSKEAHKIEEPTRRLQQVLCEGDFNAQTFDENFQANIPILVQLCMYLENWKCLRLQQPEIYTIEKKTIDKLVGFSRIQPPYEVYSTIKKSQLEFCGSSPDKSPQSNQKKVVFSSDFRRYNAVCPFGTPSHALVQLLFEYAAYFETELPYYTSDGQQNVWIVKAAASSKGAGISLQDKTTSIIVKGNEYKIVQKYVENCLLFKSIADPQLRILQNRKFDIRQWVLVKSFNPLQVYLYSDFYLRICADDYDTSDIKNPYRHLTNYSRNKSHFNQPKDSVLSSSDFKSLLRTVSNVEFDKDILPAIKVAVIKSLRSYQGIIKPSPSCFELYGYDFLLTSSCQPLLLEVNMSPACSQRAEWLTDMLNQMAVGMLSLVLPKRLLDLNCKTNRWKLIYQD